MIHDALFPFVHPMKRLQFVFEQGKFVVPMLQLRNGIQEKFVFRIANFENGAARRNLVTFRQHFPQQLRKINFKGKGTIRLHILAEIRGVNPQFIIQYMSRGFWIVQHIIDMDPHGELQRGWRVRLWGGGFMRQTNNRRQRRYNLVFFCHLN